MGTYKEIRRITASVLRELCIRHDWYTHGDNEEYDHLLQDLAAGKPHLGTADIVAIAEDIAAHSDLKDEWTIEGIAFDVAHACTITFRPFAQKTGDGDHAPPRTPSRLSEKIEDALLEEACRQWYAFIQEDTERCNGEGFAYFCRTLSEQLLNDKDFMENFQEGTAPFVAELPELCYSILPSTGALICIKRGEARYYPSVWDTGAEWKNREIAGHNNEKLGVTQAQRLAMEIGSMCGWDAPGADPKAHERAAQGDL